MGKWKRQHEQQGDYAFPGNGKQRGEGTELRPSRQQLAQVTMERDVLKRHSPSSRSPRSEVSAIEALAGRHPVAPMCRLFQASSSGFYACSSPLGERDGESASEQGDPQHPPQGEWDLWPSPNQDRVGGHEPCVWSILGRSTDARNRPTYSFAQALVTDFQQSSCSASCPEPFGSPVRLGSRQ